MSFLGHTQLSVAEFEELEVTTAAELRTGDRAFTPAMGTVLLGHRPVYGVIVIGTWWDIEWSDGQIVATRSDGWRRTYKTADYATETVYVRRAADLLECPGSHAFAPILATDSATCPECGVVCRLEIAPDGGAGPVIAPHPAEVTSCG